MAITIRVYRTGGGPVSGKEVKVHSGLGVSTERTDSTGTANFTDLKSGRYKVYVDGKVVHDGAVVGVCVVYI